MSDNQDIGELGLAIYDVLLMMPSCYIVKFQTKLNKLNKKSTDETESGSNGLFISETDHPDDLNNAITRANNWVQGIDPNEGIERFKRFYKGEFDIIENEKYEEYQINSYEATGAEGATQKFIPEYGTKELEFNAYGDAINWIRDNGGTTSNTNPKAIPRSYYKHSYHVEFQVEEYNNSSGETEEVKEYLPTQEAVDRYIEENSYRIIGEATIEPPPDSTTENAGNFKQEEMAEKIASVVAEYFSKKVTVGTGLAVSGSIAGGTFSGVVGMNTKPVTLPKFKLDMKLGTKGIQDLINSTIEEAVTKVVEMFNGITQPFVDAFNMIANLKEQVLTIKEQIINQVKESIENVKNQIENIKEQIKGLKDKLKNAIESIKEQIQQKIQELEDKLNQLKDQLEQLLNDLKELPEKIKRELLEKIEEAKQKIQEIKDTINNMIEAIKTIPEAVKVLVEGPEPEADPEE